MLSQVTSWGISKKQGHFAFGSSLSLSMEHAWDALEKVCELPISCSCLPLCRAACTSGLINNSVVYFVWFWIYVTSFMSTCSFHRNFLQRFSYMYCSLDNKPFFMDDHYCASGRAIVLSIANACCLQALWRVVCGSFHSKEKIRPICSRRPCVHLTSRGINWLGHGSCANLIAPAHLIFDDVA